MRLRRTRLDLGMGELPKIRLAPDFSQRLAVVTTFSLPTSCDVRHSADGTSNLQSARQRAGDSEWLRLGIGGSREGMQLVRRW
jgi:hypothetical protein